MTMAPASLHAAGAARMNQDLTVFVVDDDENVRTSLQKLIQSVGLKSTTFPSAQHFLTAYKPNQAGCLVLDVRMPGTSGLDLQETLAAQNIKLPIVFITGHADVPTSVRAMKGNATDFIQKPFSAQTLLDAIHRALAKAEEIYEDEATKSEILRRVELLTPREKEVLALVVTGRPNKQIAAELGTSEKTIKVHRARVMKKLQAESLPHLVLLSQAVGIGVSKVRAP
jgi:RNA polymerase sigma factor (sigma-70 family)